MAGFIGAPQALAQSGPSQSLASPSPSAGSSLEAEGGAADAHDAAGDIIVTAERTSTRLQETPLSVGVLGGDALERNGVKKLWDANGLVPGLYMSSYPSNMQYISIRGIGTADPGVFAAVGYYLDDVYLGRTFGRGPIDLPDVERVEVLRGPQGTLYGQNTTGGAVRFISRAPSLTDGDNWVSVSAGNYGALETHAYLSGPIVDGVLAGSFAFSHRQNDGDVENLYRHTSVNRLDVDQYRAQLRWTPVERLDVRLAVDGTADNSDNWISTPNNSPNGGVPRTIYANTDSEMHRRDLGVSLRAQYDLTDHLSISSVTSNRRDRTDPHPWDQDALPTDSFGWNQRFTERVFSQEFLINGDFGRLTFTGGANYYNERFDFDRLQWLNANYTNLEAHIRYISQGVFVQGHYDLFHGIGVTAGARYNEEIHKSASASYLSNIDRDRLALNYSVGGLRQTDSSVTPKFGIDWRITPDIFTYASYTVGEKSGGFNRAAGTLAIASVPVDPEEVTAIEVGAKTSWFDNRLTFNAAAFKNDFSDYQATVTNPIINGAPVNGNVVVNAGSAETYGLELESVWLPLDGLDVRASAAWLETEFTNFVNPTGAANQDFTGNEVPNAPAFIGGVQISYTLPYDIFGGQVRADGSVRYVRTNYTDIANNPALRADSQTYVNAGLDYSTGDHAWSLGVQVKNLFDETYVLGRSINAGLGTDTTAYSPPRTWLVTLRRQL